MNNNQKTTFGVKGMHCASCVRVIERALKKVDGVSDAVVNFATEQATVSYADGKVTDQQLADVVAKVGYTPQLSKNLNHKRGQEDQMPPHKHLLKD